MQILGSANLLPIARNMISTGKFAAKFVRFGGYSICAVIQTTIRIQSKSYHLHTTDSAKVVETIPYLESNYYQIYSSFTITVQHTFRFSK